MSIPPQKGGGGLSTAHGTPKPPLGFCPLPLQLLIPGHPPPFFLRLDEATFQEFSPEEGGAPEQWAEDREETVQSHFIRVKCNS